MPKLYFKYGCMNSSKTANLLMIKHNYEEKNFKVILIKSSKDTREGSTELDRVGLVKTRIGLESDCLLVHSDESIIQVLNVFESIDFKNKSETSKLIVMIDEAQFLTAEQVEELYKISFILPVLAFGLLTSSKQELFDGSKRLIELAESISEIKTICKCGARASINARKDTNDKFLLDGETIKVGGNESYEAVCKYCFNNQVGVWDI